MDKTAPTVVIHRTLRFYTRGYTIIIYVCIFFVFCCLHYMKSIFENRATTAPQVYNTIQSYNIYCDCLLTILCRPETKSGQETTLTRRLLANSSTSQKNRIKIVPLQYVCNMRTCWLFSRFIIIISYLVYRCAFHY